MIRTTNTARLTDCKSTVIIRAIILKVVNQNVRTSFKYHLIHEWSYYNRDSSKSESKMGIFIKIWE